jgi:hypothetical protein
MAVLIALPGRAAARVAKPPTERVAKLKEETHARLTKVGFN